MSEFILTQKADEFGHYENLYGRRIAQYKRFRDDLDILKKDCLPYLGHMQLHDLLKELKEARQETAKMSEFLDKKINVTEVLIDGHPPVQPGEHDHHIKHGNILDKAFKQYHDQKDQESKQQNEIDRLMTLNDGLLKFNEAVTYTDLIGTLIDLKLNPNRSHLARQVILDYIYLVGLKMGAFYIGEEHIQVREQQLKYIEYVYKLVRQYPNLIAFTMLTHQIGRPHEEIAGHLGLSLYEYHRLVNHVTTELDRLLMKFRFYYRRVYGGQPRPATENGQLERLVVHNASWEQPNQSQVWEENKDAGFFWTILRQEISLLFLGYQQFSEIDPSNSYTIKRLIEGVYDLEEKK